MEEASRCLVLLAEILQERFAEFYVWFVDVLTQGLDSASSLQLVAALKTNLQVLSLQNLGLCSSAVEHLLDFSSLLSRTRLHPNHNVVVNSAATYLFCLQHGLEDVAEQAIASLMKELEQLKFLLENVQVSYHDIQSRPIDNNTPVRYSEHQLLSLMKFDLKILLATVSANSEKINGRVTRLTSFISEKLDPFGNPFHNFLEMQFQIFSALHKLSNVELTSNIETSKACNRGSGDLGSQTQILLNQRSHYVTVK